MIQLTLQNDFNSCECNFAAIDNTNFKPTAVNGFNREGTPLATDSDFHLSDGIFLDILYEDVEELNVFNNTDVFPKPIRSVDVKAVYADNFPHFTDTIPYDGGYYYLKLFIVTKTFYNSSVIDKTKPALYYDSSYDVPRIVYFDKGAELPIYTTKDLVAFLHSIDVSTLKGVIMNESYQFSICHLQYCYNQKLKELLDIKLGYDVKHGKYKCPTGDCPDRSEGDKDIDFLRNALAALKYLIECENYNDAQRLINLLSKCGGICSKHVKVDGCGCK